MSNTVYISSISEIYLENRMRTTLTDHIIMVYGITIDQIHFPSLLIIFPFYSLTQGLPIGIIAFGK